VNLSMRIWLIVVGLALIMPTQVRADLLRRQVFRV